MTANTETKTPQELVVSDISLSLAKLALRLAEASKRYADGAAKVDAPGPDQIPLIWQLEQDLGDLAEDVHDCRRGLRRVRRGDKP